MGHSELLALVFMFLLPFVLAIPLGFYMAKVYGNKKTFLDPILNPIENFIFRLSGLTKNDSLGWKQNMYAMLGINFIWFLLGILILNNQALLPLNPNKIDNQSTDLAFNTVVSFLVNCNLQHYSGETGVSYLSQLYLMFLQFVTAATGIASAVHIFVAFKEKQTENLGHFYVFFVKSITRVLIPISIIISAILVFNGTPMTFDATQNTTNLEGKSMLIATGPVAAFVPIKHLGTNGGGFFGANSAHPFENPNFITNITEMTAQMLIPMAMIFAFGFYIRQRKLSWVIYGVMTLGFLFLTLLNVIAEIHGNPLLEKMGVDVSLGNMEGKEVRFGSAASAFWSVATTVISTGSINAMHSSFMPLSGLGMLLGMLINAFYGGAGVGLLNYLIFIILAVFISGLMVGRTPEFLGKKIEAKEIKIAMIIALLHPLLILTGTALAVYLPSVSGTSSVENFHSFTEKLYEFTSASANNGSGFEGLVDNTPFWNISTGIVMLLGRFLPIIGPVAIAGYLAKKRHIPESSGTLRTDTPTFGLMTLIIILLIAALSFIPALALGPIAEQLVYFKIK